MQTAVIIQGRNGRVHALQHIFGHNDFILFKLLVLHHHGTGIVHDEVEALDFFVARRRGGDRRDGVAQYKSSRKNKKTN